MNGLQGLRTAHNNAAEEAPRFAAVRITSTAWQRNRVVFEINKPDSSSDQRIGFVGTHPIAADGSGGLWLDRVSVCLGTASPGDEVGPVDDSWELSTSATTKTHRVLGVRDSGQLVVETLGGGGDGGSADYRVRVYDNPTNRTTTVRCLPETFTGGEWVVDTDDDFVEAYPAFDQAINLASDGCCGGDGLLTAAGASLVSPIMSDNRVTDAEETAVTIEAVDTLYYLPSRRAATCTITVTDGTNSISDTATFDSADGTASVTLDFTAATPAALTKGVLKVTLEPEDVASNALRSDELALTYSNGDNSTELNYFTGQAQTPDLVDASDTGQSASDNYTSDTTPTLRTVWNNTSPIGTGGPTPRVYANGTLLVSGSASSYDTGPGEDVADLTPVSAMSEGVYNLQLVYDYNPSGTSYYGPASEPLQVTISADADEAVSETIRSYRQGIISVIQGVVTLREIGNCPFDMSAAEISKVDA